MSKRKQTHEMEVEDDSSEEQVPDLVDVNFDYYNVNAENDYHAINRLFMQLFGADAERVQTGPLTDLVTKVAEESGVGSTIKTDEEEGSDPYAILTVISCHDHPELGGLIDYVLSKTEKEAGFHGALTSLLQDHARCHVGLVLSERLINMPVEVMGPMYKMLLEEIEEAIEEGRGYQFTHYLFLSRVYRLSPEEEETRDPKRCRTTGVASQDGVYGYHPEDDEIMQHGMHALTDAALRVILVPGERLTSVVEKIEETYAVGESGRR